MKTARKKKLAKKRAISVKAERLLRGVIRQISADPRRLNMHDWILHYPDDGVETNDGLPPCGTTACIAGWVTLTGLSDKELTKLTQRRTQMLMQNALPFATKQLGIDDEQAYMLFYEDDWPREFRNFTGEIESKRQAAKRAVRRIEHFIATGK